MGSSNFTSSLGYHHHHCSCCCHCCHHHHCHCCYHCLSVPILVITIFNLIIAIFNLVVAVFDIIVTVFDIIIIVDVDIVILFPPNAGQMLPNPSAGLVSSRWSFLPSWPSQPLRWEVQCWDLILRWFAWLGLLLSSFPTPALSSPHIMGVSSWVIVRYGGVGCGGGQWDGTSEEMVKMNHDFHRGSFSGHTIWASHFLGPPSHFSLPYSPVKHQENRPHPFGKGRGGCALSSLLR